MLQNLGGGERVRTDDLLRARQALSQLSYTPGKPVRREAPGVRGERCRPLLLTPHRLYGGPGWTRTTDLTIISRVL